MEKIDRKNKIPLYIQIYEIIKTRIENNIYNEGTLIPSENELSKEFGVTRSTIRNAIKELQKKELIYTEKGKGSIVKNKSYNDFFAKKYSMRRINTALNDNFELKFKVISQNEIIASEEIRNRLTLDTDEKVYETVKVIFCEKIPEIVEFTYIPVNKNPENLSTYEIIENKYSKRVNEVIEYIQPAVSDIRISKLLDIKEECPVYLVTRITKNKQDIIEFKRIIIRRDRYILYSEYSK